jgi:hypothetical protein
VAHTVASHRLRPATEMRRYLGAISKCGCGSRPVQAPQREHAADGLHRGAGRLSCMGAGSLQGGHLVWGPSSCYVGICASKLQSAAQPLPLACCTIFVRRSCRLQSRIRQLWLSLRRYALTSWLGEAGQCWYLSCSPAFAVATRCPN